MFLKLTEVTLTGTSGVNILLTAGEEYADVIGSAPILNHNRVEKIFRNWGPFISEFS